MFKNSIIKKLNKRFEQIDPWSCRYGYSILSISSSLERKMICLR
jgi:hypothetical protein